VPVYLPYLQPPLAAAAISAAAAAAEAELGVRLGCGSFGDTTFIT